MTLMPCWNCCSGMSPELRSWLSSLYSDLRKPLGASYSIDLGVWHTLSSCLTDDLHFHQTPPGSSIPVGARLLSARHVDLSCKRVRMRVADVRSVNRKLLRAAASSLNFGRSGLPLPRVFAACLPFPGMLNVCSRLMLSVVALR